MIPELPHQGTPSTEDEARNRRINRKLDIALLPFLSLLYLFNGLDRGNVGNAQTQGFTHDIGAAPDDLNFAVSIFFLTFVLLQPFSAAIGRSIGAERWIPIMMFCWGILTIAQAFIKGRGSLIATRLLIGAFEAGFYPTAAAYLSTFYRPFDLAARLALFYGQYAVAGAFSGAIAYGAFRIRPGPAPLLLPKPWQYLFVIEGALTCLFALVAWAWLPAGPGSAWFLAAAAGEREFAARRMGVDDGVGSVKGEGRRLTRRDVVETARDWKLWYVLVFNICASVPSTAFSVFLPLVVQGLGYDSIEANLMSVPPYVCGAIGLYLFALSSDRHKERGLHICGGIVIALVGLAVMLTATSGGCRYAGLCVLLFGSYVAPPLTVAWLSGNTPEPGKRSLVLGVNGWGNLAGVVGSQLYRAGYAPAYRTPLYVTLGLGVVALLGYAAYRFTLRAVNEKRRRLAAGKSEEEAEEERTDDARYADAKWTFIYGL
ncbi:major facilitator superfamily transporter [Coniochaeta sp. PMI_546]|nr:major facilitator superfamily transporter [Coniochaeta sp. PMI_546]